MPRRFVVGSGGEKAGKEIGQVGLDGKVGLDRRLLQFERINVDDGLEGCSGKIRPIVADEPDVQPAAKHEQEVSVLHRKISRAIADRTGTSRIAGMLVPQQIIGIPCRDRGHAELLEDLQKNIVTPAQADA